MTLLTLGVLPAAALPQSYSVIFADWTIIDQQNRNLGFLNFFEVSTDAPGADGELHPSAGYFTSVADLDVRVRNLNREAYDFDVSFSSRSSGEVTDGRLLVSLTGSNPNVLHGSLELDGRFKLISLVRKQPGQTGRQVASNEVDALDSPGFGVSGPAYRLRGVPEGGRLIVRSTPDRSGASVASLDVFATEIAVLECTPNIDPVQFQNASKDVKRRLLAGTWCQIQTPAPTSKVGYVLGRYLDPMAKP
ncbi:MAG: SH3 domain-containing protein [Pseudomonadota bacterium]